MLETMLSRHERQMFRYYYRQAVLLVLVFLLGGCSALDQSGKTTGCSFPPITDSSTRGYHFGKFVWADLITPDVARAKIFYGSLFGWSFSQYDRYTMITNNGKRIAGIVNIVPASDKMPQPLWLPVMSVADVDRAAAFVRHHGGRILKGPLDMRGRGRAALVQDPQGAELVILHAATGDPADGKPGIGDWIWNEIWTNVPEKTAAFYSPLGNYTSMKVGDVYEILLSENRWRAGIRFIFKDPYKARWVLAVRVKDPVRILARVKKLGGTVLLRPDEPPSNGDTALIADPDGALLMLQRWPVDTTEDAQ